MERKKKKTLVVRVFITDICTVTSVTTLSYIKIKKKMIEYIQLKNITLFKI